MNPTSHYLVHYCSISSRVPCPKLKVLLRTHCNWSGWGKSYCLFYFRLVSWCCWLLTSPDETSPRRHSDGPVLLCDVNQVSRGVRSSYKKSHVRHRYVDVRVCAWTWTWASEECVMINETSHGTRPSATTATRTTERSTIYLRQLIARIQGASRTKSGVVR